MPGHFIAALFATSALIAGWPAAAEPSQVQVFPFPQPIRYNHHNDIWGNTRDIIVKDSTLRADVAHAVMIGIHGNTPSAEHPDAEIIERATFSNIDVLEHDEDEADYQGAIGLLDVGPFVEGLTFK